MNPSPEASRQASSNQASVSVAVVTICGASHLSRCLDALRAQSQAPEFEVVVVHDPGLLDVPGLTGRYPEARIISNEGQRSPIELASRAVRECRGELILLTEDHCIPAPDWVRTMHAAQRPDRAAVGGRVEIRPGASGVDWAFYFVDFFRYAAPVREGPFPTLTVCNVAYSRSRLESVADLWQTHFHETAVNDALRQRFGALWLDPTSAVTMRRRVRLRDALHERYAFGRLFACTRLDFVGPARRVYYAIFSLALPGLLLGRMARKAAGSTQLRGAFARSLLPLLGMVLSWSVGEWLGYWTRSLPASLVVAPEQPEN